VSSKARAHQRRTARAHAKGSPHAIGVQLGWCATKADLEQAKRETHDVLIAQMGSQRVGGVSWMIATGEGALKILNDAWPDADEAQEHHDYYRRIGAHLREYGGFLVVATAPGRRGRQS